MTGAFHRFDFLFPVLLALALTACQGEKSLDGADSSSSSGEYSGNVIVTSVATDPATGPGLVSAWKADGTFVETLRDLYSGSEWASGSGFISPDKIVLAIEGVDRLEIMSLATNLISTITNVNLTSNPLHQLAVDSTTSSIFVAETSVNTVEKFTSTGSRVGSPFLPTTNGSCVLASPWGVTVLPNQNIVVIGAAASGRFTKYDKDGNCLTQVTAAPFNAGTPTAVAYHALSGKLLVTFATTHAIYAVDVNGGAASQIYLNSSIINTPRSIATDADGYIYVGSSGTDTVEKLYWSGTGTASRATSGPLIGPGVFTQNPTSITVVP